MHFTANQENFQACSAAHSNNARNKPKDHLHKLVSNLVFGKVVVVIPVRISNTLSCQLTRLMSEMGLFKMSVRPYLQKHTKRTLFIMVLNLQRLKTTQSYYML
jgi:hypothetical protein